MPDSADVSSNTLEPARGAAPLSSSSAAAPKLVDCRRFRSSYGSIGVVLEFILAAQPFESMQAKVLYSAVKEQIAGGYHVAAFRSGKLIGYFGWLNTTEAIARKWMTGQGKLVSVARAESNAVALTVVRAIDSQAILPGIRKCRELNAGRRVFFKREGTGAMRKSFVFNRR
jgi:hypothetical protein